MALSTYERELLAIIFAVKKWQQYLMDKHFVIRTDQQSLKHLLDNRIATPFQQEWLSKLMGLDYEIVYKQGTDNKAADALSRVEHGELLQLVLSHGNSDLYDSIQASWQDDMDLSQLIHDIQLDPTSHPKFSWHSNELRRKGKLVVGNFPELKDKILQWLHDSSQGGHSGVQATFQKVSRLFYWSKMRKDIADYIRKCVICQKCKADTAA